MKIGGHNGFMPYMAVANGIAGSLSGPSQVAVSSTLQHGIVCNRVLLVARACALSQGRITAVQARILAPIKQFCMCCGHQDCTLASNVLHAVCTD